MIKQHRGWRLSVAAELQKENCPSPPPPRKKRKQRKKMIMERIPIWREGEGPEAAEERGKEKK